MNKKEAIKTRTIPFVFSDATRDSYGTVLSVEGWDLNYFNKMGVALYNHSSYGSDPDNVIGRATARVEGKRLVGEITFETAEENPKAEKVFQKLLKGTIKGCSVGFRTMERGQWGEGEEAIGGKKATYYYGKRELIEISVTPFPANSNAHVRSAIPAEGEELDTKEINFCFGEIRSFDLEEEPKPDDVKKEAEAKQMEEAETRACRSILLAEAMIAES